MKRMLAAGMLATAFGLGTWVSWGLVPLIGMLWGVVWARAGAGREAGAAEPTGESRWIAARLAALSAALGWIGWLGYTGLAGQGGLGRLLVRLAAVLQLPPAVLLAGTIALPALLAGTAALIGSDLASSFRTSRPRGSDVP